MIANLGMFMMANIGIANGTIQNLPSPQSTVTVSR
jgi:hypothetical protein